MAQGGTANGQGGAADGKDRRGTHAGPTWAPPSAIRGKQLIGTLREKARESVWQRMEILEGVADGRIGYRRVSEKSGPEMAEPTPKDRIAALRLLAEMGGIFVKDEQALQAMGSDEQLTKAISAALLDPGVRQAMLDDPEIMARIAASMAGEPPAPDPATPWTPPPVKALPRGLLDAEFPGS